jgi:hypothetical protein
MTVGDAVPGTGLGGGDGTAPSAVIDAERAGRPNAGASWHDWLLDRIRAAPGPSWALYLVMFGAWVVVGHVAVWLGGAVPSWTLDTLTLVQAIFPPIALAGVVWMNAVALRSLRTLRPALTMDDAGVRGIAADLVRTPRGLAAAAGLAGVAFGIASVLTNPEVYYLRPGVGPILWVWVLVYSPLVDALTAAAVVHGVHQVRVVMGVHRDLVRVDLFRLDPLYAFSNLTAILGIAAVASTGAP